MKTGIILSLIFLTKVTAMQFPEKIDWVSPDHPVLSQRAEEIGENEIETTEFQEFCDRVLDFAHGNQKDGSRSVLVGLAAPQIGVQKRIISVDVAADGVGGVNDLHLYINPKIIEFSDEKGTWYEGCFSTGSIVGLIERPERIIITAFNRYGEKIEEEHTGYVARIFQHEIDHLNGIRFPEREDALIDLHIVYPEEFPIYRNQQGWRSWHRKANKADWEKIKGDRV